MKLKKRIKHEKLYYKEELLSTIKILVQCLEKCDVDDEYHMRDANRFMDDFKANLAHYYALKNLVAELDDYQ